MKKVNYGHNRTLTDLGFDQAVGKVTAELKQEGFGVLTEIDVQEILKKKLGVDFRRYKILGACNPPLAHQALTTEPEIGLLLPCNVVVAEEEDGRISVSIASPKAMFRMVDNPDLADVADQAEAKLLRVLGKLG
jgi:uncharacterized protein (DUF302 family)